MANKAAVLFKNFLLSVCIAYQYLLNNIALYLN
jgi:hypothetical protein